MRGTRTPLTTEAGAGPRDKHRFGEDTLGSAYEGFFSFLFSLKISFPVQCDFFNGSTLLTDRDSTVIHSLVYLIDHFSGMSVNSVFHVMQIALI